ncbi:hypothetical protein AVEN_150776-1 [Araneus ventricosus]|uniref:Lipoyl-binding domain-containing protein n=1 Tax=Araneus ventricosus TaxID=182803 RepID=A0A4Y2G5F4_ARAVE|nr:hypothetical protein AVEN_150776-1 [Araneus ventricosus]
MSLDNLLLQSASAIDPVCRKHSLSLTLMKGLPDLVTNVISVAERDAYDLEDSSYQFLLPTPKFQSASAAETLHKGAIAPMPGVIEKVNVKVGDKVKKGDPLVVLIAMKMEYVIKSHCNGTIKKVNFNVGANVKKNAQLVELTEDTSK